MFLHAFPGLNRIDRVHGDLCFRPWCQYALLWALKDALKMFLNNQMEQPSPA